MTADTVMITGHGGDEIEAYVARPREDGPRGGVVVIHHMPGYDRATKEIVRRFAELGYDAICPNLYWREAPGAAPDDAAATARAQGGVPDERLVGDVGGGAEYLRSLPGSNGKVGVIGYCSGGRQSVLAACNLDARRGGRLLRRLRRRDAARGVPAQGDQPRRPAARTCARRCWGCSATRTRTRAPSRSTSSTRSSPPTASRTSSTATTTPATRSSPSTGPPTAWPRPTTAGSGSTRSTTTNLGG